MNKPNQEEFYDELCLNLYLELYKKNKPSISSYNLSAAFGSISATSFVLGSFVAPNELMTGACWSLCAAAGIFTFLALYKRHKVFCEIEKEVLKSATRIVETQEKVNAVMGQIVSMFGLSINFIGTLNLDDEAIMEMSKDNPHPNAIIEADYKVIDDDEEQLALSQERAFALREYINDVAYEGYEEDLANAEMLIMELVRCTDNDAALKFNYEVNELAQKAYNKALDLYGMRR